MALGTWDHCGGGVVSGPSMSQCNWPVMAEDWVSLVVHYSSGLSFCPSRDSAQERKSQAMVPGVGSGMTNDVSLW